MTNALMVLPPSRPQVVHRPWRVRRGAAIFPAPVAVAEFAGGEKIRMTFWQAAGRPWNFDHARRLVAQVIGNERARSGAVAAAGTRAQALASAIHMAQHGATAGERDAGAYAAERLQKAHKPEARQIMARLAALIDGLPNYGGHRPATDFVAFHIEHDGKIIQPPAPVVRLPKPAARQLRGSTTKMAVKVGVAVAPPAKPVQQPRDLVRLLAAVIGSAEAYGPEFLGKIEMALIEHLGEESTVFAVSIPLTRQKARVG